MAVKVIYNMQWSALKSKQWMCTAFTTDSRAYFFLMKNISYHYHISFQRYLGRVREGFPMDVWYGYSWQTATYKFISISMLRGHIFKMYTWVLLTCLIAGLCGKGISFKEQLFTDIGVLGILRGQLTFFITPHSRFDNTLYFDIT